MMEPGGHDNKLKVPVFPNGFSYFHFLDSHYEVPSIRRAISTIEARWAAVRSSSKDDPVFLLASSWRSGSTLLQRMLSGDRLVWGEPYSDTSLVPELAATIASISKEWPSDDVIVQDSLGGFNKVFSSPSIDQVLNSHLTFFESLFASQAKSSGRKFWGIKEVRWSAEIAFYLRWLFPKARFLFLVRNPYDAFRSYVAYAAQAGDWFVQYPNLVLSAQEFGRHWCVLTKSFLEHYQELGGIFVDYDSLRIRSVVPLIEKYLQTKLDLTQFELKPLGSGPPANDFIEDEDLRILRSEVEPLASEFGFFYGSSSQNTFPHGHRQLAKQNSTPLGDGPIDTKNPIVRQAINPADVFGKCAVLVPCNSSILHQCEKTLRKLQEEGFEVRRLFGVQSIDIARNVLATNALADGFEHLLWIDSDTEFTVESVKMLLSHDLPILTGLVAKKGERAFACNFPPCLTEVQVGVNGGLYKINQVGAAFIRVDRCVYEEMKQFYKMKVVRTHDGLEFYPFYMPSVVPWRHSHWYMGEDFSFIHRARSIGFKVYADTRIRLGHLGIYPYSWEDVGSPIQRSSSYRLQLD